MTAERTRQPQWKSCTLWEQIKTYGCDECDEVRATIELVMDRAVTILDKAETAPKDFTLHNSEHSYRVAELMTRIIPGEVLPQLSIYECTLLLLSGHLHDIGMTPERSQLTAHFEYLLTGAETTLGDLARAEFEEWLSLNSSAVVPLTRSEKTTVGDLRQAREIITYYCRARHNDWSEEWIRTNLSSFPLGSYTDWLDDLIKLCRSHHEGYKELASEAFDPVRIGGEVVQRRYLAAVLRLADILDIDPERTPAVILQHRDIADASVIYWHKDLALTINIEPPEVTAFARPQNAKLHKAIEDTLSQINEELRTCVLLSVEKPFQILPGSRKELPHRWQLLSSRVIPNVAPKDGGYEYIDGAFRPDTSKLLQLLSGVELYQSKMAAVRELMQNAFDAVRLQIGLEHLEDRKQTGTELLERLRLQHRVTLALETAGDQIWLSCTDSGIGMTKKVIVDHLLVSGGNRQAAVTDIERRCLDAGVDLEVTAQFGIGVLSYFMIADHIEIRTIRSRQAPDGVFETSGWTFVTDGVGSFGELKSCTDIRRGSEVRLRLRREFTGDSLEMTFLKIKEYISQEVVSSPCSVTVTATVSGIKPLELSPGWTQQESDIKAQIVSPLRRHHSSQAEDPPSDLMPSSVVEPLEARDAHLSMRRDEALRLMRVHTVEGTFSDPFGHYRFHIPVFTLPRGDSLAFVSCDESDGNLRVNKIERSYCFVPESSFRVAWKGMLSREHYSGTFGGAIVEINWTSREVGNVEVNRNTFRPTGKASEKLDELRSIIFAEQAKLTAQFSAGKFGYLSCRVAKSAPSAEVVFNWISPDSEGFVWQEIPVPAIPSSSVQFEVPQDRVFDGRQVAVIRALGDRTYEYDTWGLGFGCAFVQPDLVAYLPSSSAFMTPLWTSTRATFVSASCPLLKCAFPPEWNNLMGAQFSDMAGNREPAVDVWNCSHPVVKIVSRAAWEWAHSAVHNRDPREYLQQLFEADRLAAWLMVLLSGGMHKLWDGIAEKDPKLMHTLWSRLAELTSGNADDVLLHWVASTSDGSRLRMLSQKGWGVVRGRKEVTAFLPVPARRWTVVTSK